MFRFEDLHARVHKQPFEPFRICMRDGRTYDIHHPEQCFPGRTSVFVAVPDPKLRGVVSRVDRCALGHIVRLEPLNGRRKRTRKKTG